jgi:hypothetical protein
VDPERIWAITKLKISDDIYPGYGNWPKNAIAYGSDKGNSQRNMAFIRSESNALDKMAPGESDESDGVDVFDASMAPLKVDGPTLEQGKADAAALADQAQTELFPE